MNGFLFYAIGLSLLITSSHQEPQIFREKSTCEISYQVEKKTKTYTVPAEIDAQDNELQFIVLLCAKNAFVPGGQSNFSRVSLYNKRTKLWVGRDQDPKPYEVSRDKEVVTIDLKNEIKCNKDENYLISIKIGKFKKIPRLTIENDCTVEIEIASPDHHPDCINHVSGKWFVDLNPLRRKVISLRNPQGDVLKISLCGKIAECGNEAGCKISGNETMIIGSLEKQRVKLRFNEVSVISSSKKPRKTMEVQLKCDWNVKYFSNPKLLNEGTNYKVEAKSSFGCVKLPQSCVITEENNHLTYDLRGLTAKDGTVVTNSDIRINICGDLELKGPKINDCHSQKSQVCEINGRNYLNRGSSPSFVITKENIQVTFGNGQECNENETYSTVVDFKCSFTDNKPTFVSQDGCVTKISWETSKACPKFEINEKGCSFHSLYGNVNLEELYRRSGFVQQFSPSQKLVYNVCGRIDSRCSTSDDISACFIDGNRQKIIGWNQPNLSFIDGKVQLKYTGEKCESQNKPYTLTMNMICSFAKEEAPPIVTRVDGCDFIATVVTKSACLKNWEIKNCTIDKDNFKYDLSPLIRRDGNYEIKDGGNSDITYFLNLCAPVVPREKLLFYSDAMVYMRNSSIATITKKFTSLGTIAGPTIEDGKLVVKSITGNEYSSKIFLECSDQEGTPVPLRNDGVRFEFTWKTKHACLVMKKGGRCTVSDGNISTELPGNPIELKIDNDRTYYFSLCLDQYSLCKSSGSCVTQNVSKRIQTQNGIFEYSLDVTDRSSLKTVNLVVQCDPYTFFNVSKKEIRNRGHIDVFVKTRLFCNTAGKKTSRNAERTEDGEKELFGPKLDNILISVHKLFSNNNNHEAPLTEKSPKGSVTSEIHNPKPNQDIPKKVVLPKEKGEKFHYYSTEQTPKQQKEIEVSDKASSIPCNILNVHGKQLDLKRLDCKEFEANGDIFIFNYDGSSPKCSGLICKNGDNILGFIEKCPEISYEGNSIILSYSTEKQPCHSANSSISSEEGRVEVSLRCGDETNIEVSEVNCKVAFYYTSPKICGFSNTSYASILTVILVILVFVFVLFFIIYCLYQKSYVKKCSYDKVSEDVSLVEHPKMH